MNDILTEWAPAEIVLLTSGFGKIYPQILSRLVNFFSTLLS